MTAGAERAARREPQDDATGARRLAAAGDRRLFARIDPEALAEGEGCRGRAPAGEPVLGDEEILGHELDAGLGDRRRRQVLLRVVDVDDAGVQLDTERRVEPERRR